MSVRYGAGVDRVTYRKLDGMARRAAAFLASRGIRTGDRCAILGDNDVRWCAAYLGILRLGAVAVPLDTSYETRQVETLVGDCGARVVLMSERFADAARIAARDCDVASLSDVCRNAASAASPSEAISPKAADPAVILYTSGTTADPKGVVLTHGNLIAEIEAARRVVQVDERDSILGVLPLFHALAQMANLLLPFAVGAHVVFLESLNTRDVLTALDDEGITTFCCVPQFFYLIHQRVMGEVKQSGILARTMFHGLLRMNGTLRGAGLNAGRVLFPRVHRSLGRRMRMLIAGGSSFDISIGRDLYALGLPMMQAYGLTETSGAATLTRPGEPIDTVGQPLPNVDVIVRRDEEDSDGEILIRGPIVMAGYWNGPEATARVLRDGWLHTGDLGRFDRTGRLVITGRSKEVIALSSGKNIYPEEIEAHYRQSPFIRELCILGVASAGEPSGERLHAIVVPDLDVLRERKIVNITELIRFELEGLALSLPPHKRALGFDVTLEALPRTTTGKLKRREILRTHTEGSVAARGLQPSREETVEPYVQRVIDVVRALARQGVVVRPESNLELDLGFDSMERVELLASLEQRFGIRVPEAVAQQAFVVRDLADAFRDAGDVSATAGEASWDALLDVGPADPELKALFGPKGPAAIVTFAVAKILVRVLARPRVTGMEKLPHGGAFIITPNHQSYLDPFILVGVLPRELFKRMFFVGAAEYFGSPLTAWLARQVNVIPIDADANLLSAMRAGAFGLRQGNVLVLFPEGERSIDGSVKSFRKGAAILSQHLNVPVIPVAIDGVFEIWPRNRPLDWRRLLPWSTHHVRLAIGDPMLPPERRGDYREHIARLRSAVERMWENLQRGLTPSKTSN